MKINIWYATERIKAILFFETIYSFNKMPTVYDWVQSMRARARSLAHSLPQTYEEYVSTNKPSIRIRG